MAPTQPFSSPHVHPPYPSLYLYPLNDTFIPKHISLHNGQRVKIGRQTNTKTIPGERNGYFDSKVLSRQHAEIWEVSGKIYIKDVKSSNGTFINGERLSPEGVESEPFELKNDDIVEFGIDIIGEDNKTTIHHKVAARVMCVFTDEDAHLAARVEAIPSSASLPPNIPSVLPPATSSSGSSNNFSFAHSQRRPALQSQLGGMGGSMRPPGKNGLTFDHILSRLQSELQKSRETGAELHSLSTAMNDIHDTLGGSVPQNLPHFPQSLPPVRSQQNSTTSAPAPASTVPVNPEPPAPPPEHPALSELRTELHETQASLASHVDKVRALEDMLAEHEAIKTEVAALRDLIHASSARSQNDNGMNGDLERGRRGQDDDASSIRTITPHELERVEEEDESEEQDENEEDRERARRREELGRPRTPEPSGMGMDEDELVHSRAPDTEPSTSRPRPRSPSPQPSHPALDELSARLVALSGRIDSAVEVNHSLAAQHAAAQGTIVALQDKITALEALVADRQLETQITAAVEAKLAKAVESAVEAQLRAQKQQQPDPTEGLTALMAEWKKGVEGQWSAVQEEWGAERERLRRAFEGLENGLDARVSTVVASHVQAQTHARLQNGDLKLHTANVTNPLGGGLVTPPSPVSVASNPGRGKTRRRRRSRSPSVSSIELDDDAHKTGNGVVNGNDAGRSRSPSLGPSIAGSEPEVEGESEKHEGVQPLTPESSVTDSGGTDTVGQKLQLQMQTQTEVTQRLHSASTTITAAVGVLVLSVAAAAVLYRMKPE